MRFEKLNDQRAEQFRDMRLRAFRDAPDAFGSSYEEEMKLSPEQFARKYEGLFCDREDHFILGAFDEADRLIGVAGFYREPRIKNRHKGVIWGMFVVPEARNRGIARALLEAIVDRARRLPDLRQINLAVTSDNAFAKTLYLSMGFRVYGVEEGALKVNGRFIDEDLMVLRLDKRVQ